ncbi:TonB-dependent receptor [Myxococcaceae bacterium GXIMD 01537]
MKTLASVLYLLLATGALAQAPDAGTPPSADAGAAPTGVLTKAPVLKRQVEAPYPPEALAQQLEGTVVLVIDISETGAVTDVQLSAPAGHGFDEAAIAAVRQFEFEPAEVDGAPAPVRIQYAYQFVWRAPPEPEPSADAPVKEGPVNFSGLALERGTRRPLVGAEVAIPALERSVTTDSEGRFAFRDVPLGAHEVIVVAANYDRYRTQETLIEGQETKATYYVRRRVFSQYETVVRSERERKEVTRTTLQVAEIQKVPGTQGDTLKVVQNLPGVARPAFNGGQLIIRGSSPEDSGVFLDGQRIPLLYHFGGLTSVYNSDLLESLDYLPGNFSAYFGNITGGVINVKSRAPRMDGLHGTVGVGLVESFAMLEGPITEDLGFAVAGRRSYVDLVLGLVPLGDDGPSLNVAPRYYDAQLKLHWTPSPRHTFTLQGIVSNDELALVFDRPADEDPSFNGAFGVTTGFQQLRLAHEYKAGPLRVNTQGLLGGTLVDITLGTARGLRISSLDTSLRSTAEYEFNEALTLAGGLDISNNAADVTARIQQPPREGEPPPASVTQDLLEVDGAYSQYFPALWAELRLRPFKGLLVVPGLRSESYVYTDQAERKRTLNPRLAARYALTDTVTLKGGAGLYHRPALRDEPSLAFGNPDLRPQRSFQYGLGVEWQPAPEWFVSTEGFYNRLDQVIVRSDALVERGGQQVPERLRNAGKGRIYGLELLVRRALTDRLFGWIAYTLSRSERQDAPGAGWRLFDNDQTHVLTAIASYKLGDGWEVGARFRFASGNPNTPIVGSRRDDLTDVFVPLYGALNSQRLPSFNQLDIRVDKTFVFDRWSLNVYLDLTNAYNNAAVEGVAYNYNYSESAYFEGLPILPVLGAKGSF